MKAGTTWYLNGEDSLDLTYEKEIKANGVTEHKHYLGMGSMSFALYTKRTGTLPAGTAAQSTSYLHNDHLGSLAAISNEAGALTERLAYDPWGKRRNVDGKRDPLALLAGKTTSRGFTMHEHLDEVGVIHMNGRVNDPLIGRFMSADTYVQAPYNLKSFNRYSYGWNNPLKLVDPTGYFTYSVGGYNDSPNSGTTYTYGNSDGTTSNYGCSSCGSHSPSSPSYQAPAGNSGTNSSGNGGKPPSGGGSVGGGRGDDGGDGGGGTAPDKPRQPNRPHRSDEDDGVKVAQVKEGAVVIFLGYTAYLFGSGKVMSDSAPAPDVSWEALGRALEQAKEYAADLSKRAQNALSSNAADEGADSGNNFPDRQLPRDQNGNPVPDPEAEGAHTQLGQKDGRNGKYDQAREFDANGKPVRDIDFTDHGRPGSHPNPHQHDYLPNPTGGTPQRGPSVPLRR